MDLKAVTNRHALDVQNNLAWNEIGNSWDSSMGIHSIDSKFILLKHLSSAANFISDVYTCIYSFSSTDTMCQAVWILTRYRVPPCLIRILICLQRYSRVAYVRDREKMLCYGEILSRLCCSVHMNTMAWNKTRLYIDPG